MGEAETTIYVLRKDGTIDEPVFVTDPEGPDVIFADRLVLGDGDMVVITSEVRLP